MVGKLPHFCPLIPLLVGRLRNDVTYVRSVIRPVVLPSSCDFLYPPARPAVDGGVDDEHSLQREIYVCRLAFLAHDVLDALSLSMTMSRDFSLLRHRCLLYAFSTAALLNLPRGSRCHPLTRFCFFFFFFLGRLFCVALHMTKPFTPSPLLDFFVPHELNFDPSARTAFWLPQPQLHPLSSSYDSSTNSFDPFFSGKDLVKISSRCFESEIRPFFPLLFR